MNLPRFTAAIFDFDETIIDLEAQHTRASELLCRAFGDDYRRMPEEYRRASGRRIVDDIDEMRRFFAWSLPAGELFAMRQRDFDEALRSSDLTLMPGAERTIRVLRARGTRLAITSSAVRSSIEEVLRRFDLRDCFELIVDGSEVHRGKPDPEAYLVTAARLQVAPAACVVFEDSTVGVQAAKAAGMFCVAVRNPRAQIRQELDAADLVVNSFEEVSP